MEEELSQILCSKVELTTPNFLSRYFRDEAFQQAEVQYVALSPGAQSGN
jgi:predicted nucleotidyltransferase